MKSLHVVYSLILITFLLILQACGTGGTSDTSGNLTISNPTLTNNNNGSYSVTATVTYTPPAGKSAAGVVITTTATDSFGNTRTDNATLNSGSNAVTYTYHVLQSAGTSTALSINSNIGGMTASVSAFIPALTPLSALNPQFTSADPLGTAKTTNIAGGIEPYRIVSVSSTDISANLIAKTLSITNNTTGVTAATATITVSDAVGNLLNIQVGYFTP